MPLVQDEIVVTRPRRIVVTVDSRDDTVKRTEFMDEVVAKGWVPTGAELRLPPWVEHGIRYRGWKLTRREGVHITPDLDGPDEVNWAQVARRMTTATDKQTADDIFQTSVMQQEEARLAEHEHRWSTPHPEPDEPCQVDGCGLRYREWTQR